MGAYIIYSRNQGHFNNIREKGNKNNFKLHRNKEKGNFEWAPLLD